METSTLKKDGAERDGVVIHTTLTREIRPIKNWCEWLDRWQEAKTLEEMLGLLHTGFTLPPYPYWSDEGGYTEIDRIKFYFTLADGWTSTQELELPEDKGVGYVFGCNDKGDRRKISPSGIRWMLARKAFDILCMNFFKANAPHRSSNRDHYYFPSLSSHQKRAVLSENFLPAIQEFFRVTQVDRSTVRIRNFPRRYEQPSHPEQQAVNFLLNLAGFICEWTGKNPNLSMDDERHLASGMLRFQLNSAKPWVVEILAQLDYLDLLRKWILELDTSSLNRLEEIAFRESLEVSDRHPVSKSRHVVTIDEACYLNSPAAWLLKEYELKMREHKRLTAAMETE